MPGKLENHTSDRKGKEKRKREEEGGEDKKAMFALLLATLKHTFWQGKKKCLTEEVYLMISFSKQRLTLFQLGFRVARVARKS